MPIQESKYSPPFIFRNGHIATIYAGLIRRVNGLEQKRERITLPDGDFLDLDWSYAKIASQKMVILLHGLEGHGQRPYMTGSAKLLNTLGYDACAVNFRGCSGETNLLFRSYHSGATEDLEAVLNHVIGMDKYSSIYIKGFSLGGNMTLKYLGEGRLLPKQLKAAVAISVPCDLHNSLLQLLKIQNLLYSKRFLNHLTHKLWLKHQKFPEDLGTKEINSIKTLKDFDDIYTSRAHGFKDAMDYYRQCSSKQFLSAITIPALIVNAKDDTFLGSACYPIDEACDNSSLHLNMPAHGGHVGFYEAGDTNYTESLAAKFMAEYG
ncbi:MAG: alpha/beta fold hydrolase [Flavobacteriaceae bacterium]